MAAPIRKTLQKGYLWKRLSFCSNFDGHASVLQLRQSSSNTPPESEETDVDIEKEINKLRDVSRMSNFQKQIMNGLTFDMDEMRQNKTKKRGHLRRMYAKYGKASGIDPSVIWPSKEELAELKEIDEDYTASFFEVRSKLQEKKEKELADIQEREKNIEKAMEKMPQLIAKFREQEQKVRKVKVQTEDQQDTIRDQFIEYFGYEPINNNRYHEFKIYKNFEISLQKKKEKKETKREKQKQKDETQEVES